MKVSVTQEQLAKGLGIVSRIVGVREPLQVLQNVLITTEDSRLKLAALNREISISTYIGAKVDREGSVTLPAKTFTELVNYLSNERVDLTLDSTTQTVNLRCGRTNSNVRGIAATEFPPLPEPTDPDVVLSGRELKAMITQTVFASAKEDNRPILTGLYIRFEGDAMTMAAADGFRLAVRTTRIDSNFSKAREFVVPARAMSEVARIIVDEDKEVGISLPDERDMVLFYVENTVISANLLEGKFPDFSVIIPKNYVTSVHVYTQDMLRDCKRAEVFARDNHDSARIVVRPPRTANDAGELTITARSNERGDSENTLEAHVEGEPLEVSFNIHYLLDVLNAMPSEQLIVESAGSAAAGVLRPAESNNLLYVIMPMANR